MYSIWLPVASGSLARIWSSSDAAVRVEGKVITIKGDIVNIEATTALNLKGKITAINS